MKLAFRILAPLVIVAAAVWFARHLILTQPEPRKFAAPPQVTSVEATRLETESFQVFLDTQGTVRPRTTSTLIPEVSGRILRISPNFREGRFFEKEDVLLEIDPVNYETALVVAKGAVAQARRLLHEEEIRSEQALENWRRLGKSGEPSDYVARKPQLAEAQANLRAAEAEVELAERNLERTKVTAPFDGRIVEQSVDVGQFVSSSTELGRAFATDFMEVRLPLTNRQLSFVELPDGLNDPEEEGPEVLITGRIGQETEQWTGHVVRVDSAIDEASRQLFVVAEVKDPYGREEGNDSALLKIGMFVDALVKGEELTDVFVLPREAVRVGGDVIVIEPDNRIRRQQVNPIWSEEEVVVIPADGGGLEVGEVVCLTPLAYPADGALVSPTIDGVTPEVEQPPGGPRGMSMGKGAKGEGKGQETSGRPERNEEDRSERLGVGSGEAEAVEVPRKS